MDGLNNEFNTPLSSRRFQAQLGNEYKRNYKAGDNIDKIMLARVVKVNYKYNTVDVVTTINKDRILRNANNNGRYSARLPIGFGGKTPDGKVYGTTTLATVGSLVLIGFLGGSKDTPIVLNIYGDADNQSQLTRTTFSSADESDEGVQRELWQLFTLYPSMTYHNIDGRGNQEISFSGRSFMYITDTDENNDYITDEGFDYDHLPSSHYANGDLIEPTSPTAPTVLYVHQGVYGDHRVTFFIKSDGTVRLGSRHLNGEGVTFQEMKTDGTFSVVQKRDTTSPEEESEKFSQMKITEEGNVILQAGDTIFEVTKTEGVKVSGGAIGGGDSDDIDNLRDELEMLGKDVISMSTDIVNLEGKIQLKADAKLIDTINNQLEEYDTQLEIAFDRISGKVSYEEYSIGIQEAQDYAKELTEGLEDTIGDVMDALENLDEYIEGAFKDGIIDRTEAKAIESYINNLKKDKQEFDNRYEEVYNNEYLIGQEKTQLNQAKLLFDTKHTQVVTAIEVAIMDGVIEGPEKEAVDTAFTEYSESVGVLTKRLEKAISIIVANKAKEAEDNAKGEAQEGFTRIDTELELMVGKISAKVDKEEYTEAIGDINTKYAQVQSDQADLRENLNNRIDDVEANTPLRVEIVSTQGNIFRNGSVDTTLFCMVYKGRDNITDSIPPSRFMWYRVSDDTSGDQIWNQEKGNSGKSVKLTAEDVNVRATFNCDILEEE